MTQQILSGTYTIVNPKTNGYRTIQIENPDPSYWTKLETGTRIISYLNGADNSTSFRGMAFLKADNSVVVWKSAKELTDKIAAARWLVNHGTGKEASLAKAYALRSGRCGFCSHKLTVPSSIENGYGPICAEKNGLPFFSSSKSASKEITPELIVAATATSTKVGWQTVKPARTYAQLFGED